MNNALSLCKPRYSVSVINYQYSNEHQVKTNDLILASLGIRIKLGGKYQSCSKARELASAEHQEKAGCKASREVCITHPSWAHSVIFLEIWEFVEVIITKIYKIHALFPLISTEFWVMCNILWYPHASTVNKQSAPQRCDC